VLTKICVVLTGQWTLVGAATSTEWIQFSGWVCKWPAASDRRSAGSQRQSLHCT